MIFNKKARLASNRRGDMQNMMNVTLMMIILAFFIVLNSLAVPAEPRRKAAIGSLTGTMGILIGGPSPMKSEGKEVSLQPAPMVPARINTALLLGKFESYAVERRVGEKITTLVTKGGVEITIESDLLFEPGVARFKPSAGGLLKQVANIVEQIKGGVRVEGYTSDRSVKSARYPSLLDLSIARSGAVARTLLGKGRIKRDRISVAGYGPMRPVVPNDSDRNRWKNDRIRIIYERAV